MAPPTSPESQVLLKLLDDGAWHPLADIAARLAAAVAPGKALRRYAHNEANRVLHHGPRKGPELSEDEKIASGRRAIATDTVGSLKKRYVEVRDDGHGQQIRRRAQVVPIADPRAAQLAARPEPAREPADADPPPGEPAMAFFCERQVRDLVAEEVGRIVHPALADALDAFQRGMQHWLVGRFAEVERAVDRAVNRGRHRPKPPPAAAGSLPAPLRRR